MNFTATLLTAGKTASGLAVPEAVLEGLAGDGRPPVSVTINGYSFRTSTGVVDGAAMPPISAEVRAHARISGGDTVQVEPVVDTSPRVAEVPADLARALESDAVADTLFGS